MSLVVYCYCQDIQQISLAELSALWLLERTWYLSDDLNADDGQKMGHKGGQEDGWSPIISGREEDMSAE